MAKTFVHRLLWAVAVCPMGLSAVLAQPTAKDCAGLPGETIGAEHIEALFLELARDPARDLKGVVVSRRGCIVAERYFNGDGPQSLHDIRSAGKSVTATLVGIAIRQGLIDGVDVMTQRFLHRSGR